MNLFDTSVSHKINGYSVRHLTDSEKQRSKINLLCRDLSDVIVFKCLNTNDTCYLVYSDKFGKENQKYFLFDNIRDVRYFLFGLMCATQTKNLDVNLNYYYYYM